MPASPPTGNRDSSLQVAGKGPHTMASSSGPACTPGESWRGTMCLCMCHYDDPSCDDRFCGSKRAPSSAIGAAVRTVTRAVSTAVTAHPVAITTLSAADRAMASAIEKVLARP